MRQDTKRAPHAYCRPSVVFLAPANPSPELAPPRIGCFHCYYGTHRLNHLRATLAQLVERLIRNQQVASSILAGGSTYLAFYGAFRGTFHPPR
jgi:hypothetical protein